MTRTDALKLVDAATAAGIQAKVYDGYSGRGMFGEQTTAVRFDGAEDLTEARIELARQGREILKPRTDSLGRGIVAY